MDMAEIRREKLRVWFAIRAIPEKEKSYISQLINGRIAFGERAARRLEGTYGMPAYYLDSVEGVESVTRTYQGITKTPHLGRVPLISFVAAGNWSENVDNNAVGNAEEWVVTTIPIKRHTYALRVKGDSMEPKFPDGAQIVVEPEEEASHGKYVIVRQNGNSEATFKQLVYDGGRPYLKPLNPRYPIMEMREDAVICGIVKQMVMDV